MAKRIWWMVAGAAVIVVLVGGTSVVVSKAKRFGKQQYFTQITQPGQPNGQASWGYTYEQPAFDREGKERRLTFRAEKSLRLQAYLRVYVASHDRVTAWEEVDGAAVPALAKEQLRQRAAASSD
ncbi:MULTISPECIES: YxeA family protein [unclassified Herbaspirillum]|uniref:YxeA family protein n=1 Tax=unclassified Herbaspirillum TaxID=2624150 RepID=UPI0011516450|nr:MULTISPECIES: YxeA family protein [unclassified Herbaspirillum]MBB5392637.1 uncharacterized protein (TIGR01655 family) [Herbaspirillum sp. SJZ102]TQK06274.1 uncharacterized protein (TIGR01655 family) [Herbaspirillum sp. SJZ130]TQK12248.1 uncharacterized protein (TIGR01655 family) [Herbaspirillum sp. SJZ106]TWC68477.1 uncharacterized protein (TIGR01655 family) [Herbaspirillum sp. SJZ099]